jgi:hypothetical protein
MARRTALESTTTTRKRNLMKIFKRKLEKKLILLGYRHPRVKLYDPKMNKKRLGLIGGFLLLTGSIPGPNFIGVGLLKVITKLDPLWFYR